MPSSVIESPAGCRSTACGSNGEELSGLFQERLFDGDRLELPAADVDEEVGAGFRVGGGEGRGDFPESGIRLQDISLSSWLRSLGPTATGMTSIGMGVPMVMMKLSVVASNRAIPRSGLKKEESA